MRYQMMSQRTGIGMGFRISIVICACFSLGLLGCGGPKFGKVTGKVTMDGKPLAGVAVRFEDEGGSATIAKTDAEGNYEMRYSVQQIGTPVGKHKVTILTPAPETEGTGERYKEKLPARYNRNSKMVEEVKGGNQTINFELTSDP